MRLALLLIVLLAPAFGAGRQVAITIDDLPRGGDGGGRTFDEVQAMTKRLLSPFRADNIPVIGFVNAGRAGFDAAHLRTILELWLDAGADLGNHTATHPNINQMPLEQYEADITRGEPILREVLTARGKSLEYFRHPFLFKGDTPAKKQGLERFLRENGYQEAPVTFDLADYMYAALFTRLIYADRVRREYLAYIESVVEFFEKRSVEVAGREFPQVLLIHANELNAQMMPELLAMFRKRGYTFVSLRSALQDETYRLQDNYVGKGGFSWIHRWSMTKHMPGKGEPDPPEWVNQAYKTISSSNR